MTLDLSVVLYNPRWDDLRSSIKSLNNCASEFRTIVFLLSGSFEDVARLDSILQEVGGEIEHRIYHRFDNLGFAEGNNYLLSKIFENSADYALLYNPDLECSPGSITRFLECVQAFEESTGEIALFGPTLSSIPKNDGSRLVDSAGIYWTASGRHFDLDQDTPWKKYEDYRIVQGLTGACLMVSRPAYTRLIGEFGEVFDRAFIAFREDAELGIRAGCMGIKSVCVMVEGIAHNRGNPGTERKSALVNLLGVQNRILMRWRLGRSRPGSRVASGFRDIVVVCAAFTVERTSRPGVLNAFALRRYERSVSSRIQTASLRGQERLDESLQLRSVPESSD